ncbi:hypothetical protein MX850_04660 [Erysipelothrix sp. Poltava]|nr:hypothetical protein MX850_04660 [Erysipelothrix sp. Poltava]
MQTRVRRQDEHAEVIMFERGPNVSFSNCALPYHLSGIVASSDDLVLMTPEQFKKQYNIIARTSTEVLKINRDAKTVTVKNLETGEEMDEAYDKALSYHQEQVQFYHAVSKALTVIMSLPYVMLSTLKN